MLTPVTDLQAKVEKKRTGYEAEGTWLRFMLDAFSGCGGFQGRVKQPLAGYWGHAAQEYSVFASLKIGAIEGAVTEESDSYLDRYPREDAVKFARRRNVAHYPNYIAPVANLYVSYLLRKPHKLSEVPERLKKWMETTKWADGARMRALLAVVAGYHPVLVDMPSGTRGALSQADAAAQVGSTEPYTVQLLPCHLVDYKADDRGNFLWAKVCVKFTRQASWDADPVRVERYTVWTPTEFLVYEVVDGKITSSEPIHKGVNPFGMVPLAIFRSSVSLEDPVKSDSMLAAAALAARRLFNMLSEFDEHLRSQVFALLVYPMTGGADQTQPKIVGTDNALGYDGQSRTAPDYLAPPGSVAETYEKRVAAMIIEIYRMLRVEYTKASGTASSAQSKEQEFEQTNLLISDLALALAQAEKQLLTIVGKGLGISDAELDKMQVVPETDFGTEQLNDEVERVIEVLTIRELGRTFRVEILQRIAQRLLPHLSAEQLKTIQSEIEEAVDQAEKDARLLTEKALEGGGEDDPPPAGDEDAEDEEDAPGQPERDAA
jgi:hypothetical protein